MALGDTFAFIQEEITRYIYPIYLPFGITGCCLNIFFLSQRQFRTVSCCAYFLTASVTMLISLGFGMGPTLYSLSHDDPTTTILAFCKARIYLLQSNSMIYRWLLAVACFDRYALSSANAHLRNFARIHIARRVIAITVCIWLILPIHTPIFYHLRDGGDGCGIFNNKIAALYHSIFTTVCGCILPSSIMIICAILVYQNLILKQQRLQNNMNQQTEQRNETERWQRKRDQQVFLMLLIQVFIFLISIAPLMIMNLYSAITLNNSNKSIDQVTIEKFTYYAVELILYLFPVSSFYLYILVSSMFRNELRRLLHSIVTCQWNNTGRVGPATATNHI